MTSLGSSARASSASAPPLYCGVLQCLSSNPRLPFILVTSFTIQVGWDFCVIDQLREGYRGNGEVGNGRGDDYVDAINHMMVILDCCLSHLGIPTTNQPARTSSNPRQQDTIYGWGKVDGTTCTGETNTSYAAGTTKNKHTSGVQDGIATRDNHGLLSGKGNETWSFNDIVVGGSSSSKWTALKEEEDSISCSPGLPDVSNSRHFDTELDRLKRGFKELKEKQNVENSFSGPNEQFAEIAHLKQNLFEQGQEKDSLIKTVSELKNKLQLEENRNIEKREIELKKEN
ncbi:hypothetical protein Tco_0271354 [Tanacetum coccineum]